MIELLRSNVVGSSSSCVSTSVTTDIASSPVSVCHVISGDIWAGAEVQVSSLIRTLSRHPDVRISAIVLNEGRLANELRESAVDVCVIPESRNNFFQILATAERFVRIHRPEILHSHRYKENLLALFLASRCGVPVKVRTQHGLSEPFHGIKALRHRTVQWLDRFSGRHWADAIFSVSTEMLPNLQRVYGPTAVLSRNGIDTTRVISELTPEQAKQKLNLPANAPTLGIVGRLEPVKRVDLFLEVARALSHSLPSAHFVVAGTGHLEADLKNQALSAGLGKRIHFLGHRDDVYDVLTALDVLAMPSDHEGLPMVLLEALWLGVPVVARNVGGMKEVLGANECGITVSSSRAEDLAAACHRLIVDRDLRAKLQANAKRRVADEFSVERLANEVRKHYLTLTRLKNERPL